MIWIYLCSRCNLSIQNAILETLQDMDYIPDLFVSS